MSSITWSAPSTNASEYYWEWGTSPQLVAIGTAPQLILEASSQPRLISYRADADPSIKIKIWKNSVTTGPHELDSFGGHNMEKWELTSALKVATVSGTANIIVNTATKVII